MSANECSHPIVIKDMCGSCGKDLRIKDAVIGEKQRDSSTACISMVHHVPELVVSNELANQIGEQDHQNTLKNRKLVLLVDLDQTLIHTTNKLVAKEDLLPDIYDYQCADGRYYTKLRPHTREFLERMNHFYEMHIISFGQRFYAHKIAGILDPDQRFFGQRIMSRDELFSIRTKTNNIQALFPKVEQRKLIVIIDDRDDVWQYSDALVRVRPYKYFAEVDDINAPVGSKVVQKTEALKPGEEKETGGEETPPRPSSVMNQDNDDVLEDIGRVLTEVHKAFFDHYDKTNEVTDVSAIVSYKRKQVLKSEVIALSGIVPIGYKKSSSLIYRLCLQFGAEVVDEITDRTTVLIAARPSTEKCRVATKKHVPIVTPEWLYTCSAKWLNVSKEEYAFNGSQFCEQRRDEPNISKMGNFEPPSRSELKNMEDEVDAALGESSDSSSDNDEGEEEKAGNNENNDDDEEEEERGSDTEGEPDDAPSPQAKPAAAEVREEEKKEQHVQEEADKDEEQQRKLRAKLAAGEGDSDDEETLDERLRNGDIDSRKRRHLECAGAEDEEDEEEFNDEPKSKRAVLDREAEIADEDALEDAMALNDEEDDGSDDDDLLAAMDRVDA